MTSMTATPLPAGFTAEAEWEDDTRCITSPPRVVPNRPDVRVYCSAVQNRDGTINTDEQPPLIAVNAASSGLTAKQARALAMRLLDAAIDAEALETWQP